MIVLGLDLGTKTGYAIGTNAIGRSMGFRGPELGTWKLKPPTKDERKCRVDRRCDPRVFQLFEKFGSLEKPGLVVFEDVQFSSTTLQTQLWSSLRTAVWLRFGREPGVIVECVPVKTLKKFATGHGGATKGMMAAAFKRDGFSTVGLDDNAIDAYFLWKWGIEKFKL